LINLTTLFQLQKLCNITSNENDIEGSGRDLFKALTSTSQCIQSRPEIVCVPGGLITPQQHLSRPTMSTVRVK